MSTCTICTKEAGSNKFDAVWAVWPDGSTSSTEEVCDFHLFLLMQQGFATANGRVPLAQAVRITKE